jgi:hypothetical protein
MSFISNSFENLPVITANISKHEAEIIKDAKAVNGDYEKFGEFVGKIIKVASEEDKGPKPTDNVPEQGENYRLVLAEIAQGLYEATKVGTFNFTALLDCIYFADQDAILLYETVKLVEQDWKDLNMVDLLFAGCAAAIAYGQF